MNIKNIFLLLLLPLLWTSCQSDSQVNKAADFFQEKGVSDSLRLAQITDSLEQFPKNIRLWIEKGSVAKENLNFKMALNAGAMAYVLDSNNLDARELYAWSLMNKPNTSLSDIELAQKHFKYILAKRPNDPKTLINLANTYALTGTFKPALENINKALKIDKNYRDGYVLKGSVYKTLQNYELALSSYQTAIQIDPDFFIGYLQTGWLLTEMKKHKLAMEYYRSAAKLKPENVNALYGIAKSYQDLKQYEPALTEYRHILSIDSSFYVANFNQGYIKQYYQKQLDSAEYYYKKVLNFNNKYVRAWFQLGEVYYDLGRRGAAEEAYSNCLRLDKNYQPAIEAAEKLKTL